MRSNRVECSRAWNNLGNPVKKKGGGVTFSKENGEEEEKKRENDVFFLPWFPSEKFLPRWEGPLKTIASGRTLIESKPERGMGGRGLRR